MRNKISKLVAVSIVVSVLVGCSSKTPEQETEENFRCKQDGQIAPKWTCVPFSENSIVGLGVSPVNAGNDYSMQRAEAMSSGRDSLANQISVKVGTMFKSYKATTGAGLESTFDKANSKVSKQIASETIKGSHDLKSWKSEKGTLFVLVGLNSDVITNSVENKIKTTFKNDNAMYQKFLAEKENGDLTKELEKFVGEN